MVLNELQKDKEENTRFPDFKNRIYFKSFIHQNLLINKS